MVSGKFSVRQRMQTAHRSGLFSKMLIPKSLSELNDIPENTFPHEWNCKYLFNNMEQDYKISCDQKLFKIVFEDCVIFSARLESEAFQFWIVDGYMYDFTVKKKSSDCKYTVSIVLHGRNTKHDATPLQLTPQKDIALTKITGKITLSFQIWTQYIWIIIKSFRNQL